jgi:hypothetical protein
MVSRMKGTTLTVTACCIALLSVALPAFGEDAKGETAAPLYAAGDQAISIRMGLFWPMFFLSFAPSIAPSNLTPGAGGSLQWGAYVTDSITVSGEVGGAFALSPNSNMLLLLPILAKAEKIFTFYPFELPVSLAAGVSFVKYEDRWAIDLMLKPGVSFYWIYDSSWAFGLNLEYWLNTQISGNAGESRVGNFVNFFVSALYRF